MPPRLSPGSELLNLPRPVRGISWCLSQGDKGGHDVLTFQNNLQFVQTYQRFGQAPRSSFILFGETRCSSEDQFNELWISKR